MEKKIGIAYVPVLHKGYINYFDELERDDVGELFLVGDELLQSLEEFDYLNRKDRIRAVPEAIMLDTLRHILTIPVSILNSAAIIKLQQEKRALVTPKEDVGKVLAEKFFNDHDVVFSDIFVRRNEANVKEDKEPETEDKISLTDFQQNVLHRVKEEAEKSSDWWRRVAAALVKDGEIIAVAHNEHTPGSQLPYEIGDARGLYKKGLNMNYGTAAHAESTVIAEAAKQGISTEGGELYVTDFPCPYCARVIAKSGIKKLYFVHGYAVLDGDEFLKEEGIEVIKVTE